MENDLISRSAAKEEILSWAVCLDKPHLLRKDDTLPVLDMIPAVDAVDAVDADKALEWLEGYTFTDTKQVYTNGTVLVPLFRVRQALKDKAYNGLMEG